MTLKKNWVKIAIFSMVSVVSTVGITVYAQEATHTEEKETQNILSNMEKSTHGEMTPIPENAIMLEKNIISSDYDS
ncbi:TPA: hypothetical protein ACGX5R_001878 [Enterococcus faecalis]|jgi:hypothetical protein